MRRISGMGQRLVVFRYEPTPPLVLGSMTLNGMDKGDGCAWKAQHAEPQGKQRMSGLLTLQEISRKPENARSARPLLVKTSCRCEKPVTPGVRLLRQMRSLSPSAGRRSVVAGHDTATYPSRRNGCRTSRRSRAGVATIAVGSLPAAAQPLFPSP